MFRLGFRRDCNGVNVRFAHIAFLIQTLHSESELLISEVSRGQVPFRYALEQIPAAEA